MEKEIAGRDVLARLFTILGLAFMLVGVGFLLLFGLREPVMTVGYTAYVAVVLTPAVYLCLRQHLRRSLLRVVRERGTRASHGGCAPLRLVLHDPVFVLLWVVYFVPAIAAAHYWPQLGHSVASAGLAPFVWFVGIAHLLHAHIWRRHGRSLFAEVVARGPEEPLEPPSVPLD